MDISTITDVKELKALAYDALAMVERSQNDLRIINARIQEVLKTPEKKEEKKED